MKILFKSKLLDIEVKKLSFFGRFTGLMFKSKNSKNLLFDFTSEKVWAIHSYFVFFDFLAVWLNENNQVLDVKIVKPWTFSVKPAVKFKKLVEIPYNSGNTKVIDFLVGKRKI